MSDQTAEQLRDLLQQAAGNAATSSEGTLETMGEAIRHNVPLPEEAADILKTIGNLKSASSSVLSPFTIKCSQTHALICFSSQTSLYLRNLSSPPFPAPLPNPPTPFTPPLPPHRNLSNPRLDPPNPLLTLLLRPSFPHRARSNLVLNPKRSHATMDLFRNRDSHRMFSWSCNWVVDG